MNQYEMVVLYHPDLEIDIDKALAKVEKVIKNADGKINKTDNWGKRKLAYSIKKEDHAVYVQYDLELEGTNLTKLENNLNITGEVLRYLIVKPGPEIEAASTKDTDKSEDSEEKKEEDE